MKSLTSWSGVVAFSLLLLFITLMSVGGFYGLIAGLCIGIGFGTAFGASISTAVHSADRKRDRQQLDRILHEHLEPTIIYQDNPLAIEAIARLTEKAVLDGFCCYCGSDDEGLDQAPFNPANHSRNPVCPVPLARRIYESFGEAEDLHEPSSTGQRLLMETLLEKHS